MDTREHEREQWKRRLASLKPLPQLRWNIDPCEWALKESVWRYDLPEALCLEIGRRVLLAQLQQSEWSLRRVEKVSFERDRSVSRRITVDLLVREDAPRFMDRQGHEFWLVPLTRLNRQTLVNFQLVDEEDHALSTAGIRLGQRLDQAILLAAAATVNAEFAHDQGVRNWTRSFIAGERPDVDASIQEFEGMSNDLGLPQELRTSPLFNFVVRRMQHAFTLYVFLPVDEGPKRLIQMTFDEPTNWTYQVPALHGAKDRNVPEWRYLTGARLSLRQQRSHVLAAFGLVPTRVRMQVPGAELATSYHFEATAPPGVRIVSASLLAGRPNVEEKAVSVDHVVGHQPTVGLHAIEVPPGSLCRVQLDLATRTRGLMSSLVIASWFVFAVLASVLYHWRNGPPDWKADSQWVNLVLILVTTAAASAALVAQESERGIAARLVAGTRAGAAVAMTLPVIAAGFLVYQGPHQKAGLFWLTLVALVIALLSSGAWISARVHETKEVIRSPWDMSPHRAAEQGRKHHALHGGRRTREQSAPTSFTAANRDYHFVTPAIGVRSAEAWLESYSWNDRQQFEAIRRLQTMHMSREDTEMHSPCPHFNSERCSIAGTCAIPTQVRSVIDLFGGNGFRAPVS